MKRISILSFLMSLTISFTLHATTVLIVPDEYPDISDAADAAQSGDTIFVRAGTYSFISHIGGTYITLKENVALLGESNSTTFIQALGVGAAFCNAIGAEGNNLINGFSIEADGLIIAMINQTKSITIKNCVLFSHESSLIPYSLRIEGSTVSIRNNRLTGSHLITGMQTISILHNIFLHENTGFFANNNTTILSGKGTIRNNVFYTYNETEYSYRAVIVKPIDHCRFINNICWENAPSDPMDIEIQDNDLAEAATITIDYCNLVNNSKLNSASQVTLNFRIHNIAQDPLFYDSDFYNFDAHLQLGSGCIDRGSPLYKDSDGTRSDMGAYGGQKKAISVFKF
ncbi:hypothetical protein ACFL1T_02155 [Chlamydiota bacterium]